MNNEFNFKKLTDNIIYEVRQFIIFKPRCKQELKKAVRIYDENINLSNQLHGDISLWDTA